MSAAWVIYFFGLMVIATSFIYIIISRFVNELILVVNPFITDGTMTTLFVQNFNFVVSIALSIPLISLLSLVIWGFVKINEEKRTGEI